MAEFSFMIDYEPKEITIDFEAFEEALKELGERIHVLYEQEAQRKKQKGLIGNYITSDPETAEERRNLLNGALVKAFWLWASVQVNSVLSKFSNMCVGDSQVKQWTGICEDDIGWLLLNDFAPQTLANKIIPDELATPEYRLAAVVFGAKKLAELIAIKAGPDFEPVLPVDLPSPPAATGGMQ